MIFHMKKNNHDIPLTWQALSFSIESAPGKCEK